MGKEYLDLSYKGEQLSDYGLIRVSSGGRYTEDLLPQLKQHVVSVPGQIGNHYFGATYGEKVFNVPVSFNNLTNRKKKDLEVLFLSGSEVGDLVFEEAPYKTYKAVITGTPNIKYIPFDRDNNNEGDILKGEGTIQFTSYYPFARCTHKDITDYYAKYKNSIKNWETAAGIIDLTEKNIDNLNTDPIRLYNPGHVPTDFYLYFKFAQGAASLTAVTLADEGNLTVMRFSGLEKLGADVGFRINTKNFVVEGFTESFGETVLTGNLYNQFMTSGNFFKIPVTKSTEQVTLQSTGAQPVKLKYDYLYL